MMSTANISVTCFIILMSSFVFLNEVNANYFKLSR